MDVTFSASVGSAWSGEIRGLLHCNGRVVAECITPQHALDLSVKLNRTQRTPEQIRNAEARREINDLLPLAKMLDGRDNQNNWTRKLEKLMACFVDEAEQDATVYFRERNEAAAVKDPLTAPEIPAGRLLGDRSRPTYLGRPE